MKLHKILILLAVVAVALPLTVNAALGDKLTGRILLQVQQRGEAWFVHPTTLKRYYLGNPSLMLSSMQKLGVGVGNEDIKGIPIGLVETEYSSTDSDGDGLADDLETAIETDLNNKDSDGDGFDDYTEVKNGYNPLGKGRMSSGAFMFDKLLGNFLLQVEQNGEAWYLNPIDGKRYFLGRPEQALEIVRKFGLGISNIDLEKIANGEMEPVEAGVIDCGKAEFIAIEEGPEQDQAIEKALVATRCFYEKFKTCTNSRVVISLFGSEYYYEIIGSDGGKCQIKELYPKPSPLLTSDYVGKSMICTYNQERGGRHFKELSEGVFSYKSGDPAYEKCEGELAELLQK